MTLKEKAILVGAESGREENFIDSMEELLRAIGEKAFTEYVYCDMLIPYDKGNIVSYLNDNAYVTATDYRGDGVLISVECREADYRMYQEYEVH